jgi:hypothetical protein
MTVGNSTGLWNHEIWPDCTFWHETDFWRNFTVTSLETLDTKNAINKLSSLLVTHMAYFDTLFGCNGLLRPGYRVGQILDRLGI